jgi:hypothetical protein
MFPDPSDWHRRNSFPNITLRFPIPRKPHRLTVTLNHIETTLRNGYTQNIPLRWIRTGFGRPRPVFVCPRCSRPVVKVYDHTGGLACKWCHNAIQLSQKLDKRTRPILKAHRLERFLALKSNINQRTTSDKTLR